MVNSKIGEMDERQGRRSINEGVGKFEARTFKRQRSVITVKDAQSSFVFINTDLN